MTAQLQASTGSVSPEVEFNREILMLLHEKRQLKTGEISGRFPDKAPTVVMNALGDLTKARMIESQPASDLHILTANGERRVRALMGMNVPELERLAAIALLEEAGKRGVSHATTLPGVGPAMAREIFGNLSARSRYLEPHVKNTSDNDGFGFLLGRLVGIPASWMETPDFTPHGHVITLEGRQHLKALKAQPGVC